MQFLELPTRKFQRGYFLCMSVCFARFACPFPAFIVAYNRWPFVSRCEYEREKHSLRTVCFWYGFHRTTSSR